MRRKEKEITLRSEMDAVINKARVCRLAMMDGDRTYIVPSQFRVRRQGPLFPFHPGGEKAGPSPEEPDGSALNSIRTYRSSAGDVPCKWGMGYRSIIGWGEVEFILEPDARRGALDIIMAHYSGESSFAYTDAEINRVSVFKVTVLEMTGKRSG